MNQEMNQEINQNCLKTNAGLSMPQLIYGTAWKGEQTAAWVATAIDHGFKGIDTACQPKHYNEAGVGQALAQLKSRGISRKSLFIQTKFTPLSGQDPQQIPYDRHAALPLQVAQSFQVSQRNLGTDYVDSLVLHAPLAQHAETMSVWQAMELIYSQGGSRQLGISNCYQLEQLERLYNEARVKPAILQNRFYQETNYDNALRSWCESKGIIYQSFWTLTANPHILNSKQIRAIAQAEGKSEVQIFFRFLVQKNIVPLTGTCSQQHMKEDLAIFTFQLAPEQMQAIETLLV